jgi:hypothetical protein
MPRNHSLFSLVVVLVLATLVGQGCGKGPSEQQPGQRAEAAVDRFLEAWTKGESPDKFAGANLGIQATDPDWKAGHRLLSFLTVDSKQSQETPPRFRCRVALTLQDRQGNKVDMDVTYDVQMGDTIVISRAPR